METSVLEKKEEYVKPQPKLPAYYLLYKRKETYELMKSMVDGQTTGSILPGDQEYIKNYINQVSGFDIDNIEQLEKLENLVYELNGIDPSNPKTEEEKRSFAPIKTASFNEAKKKALALAKDLTKVL